MAVLYSCIERIVIEFIIIYFKYYVCNEDVDLYIKDMLSCELATYTVCDLARQWVAKLRSSKLDVYIKLIDNTVPV